MTARREHELSETNPITEFKVTNNKLKYVFYKVLKHTATPLFSLLLPAMASSICLQLDL